MTRYLIGALCLYMALSACVDITQDRLIITGKTIKVPPANMFCTENPESVLCTQ